MSEEKISNGKLLVGLFLIIVGAYGLYWSATTLHEELNKPLNDYDCSTAEECYYMNPSCKTYAIEGKSCVRDGMTGGFLDSNIYYICEGYGKMTNSCQNYYSFEEHEEWLNKMWDDVLEVQDE